jgi:NAD(P)-dependent dehydrogenase (short-subunit alcohol dehydrogenase family)
MAARAAHHARMSDQRHERVVVLGGSSGIGEATARRFASAGADVHISGRDDTRGPAAAERTGASFHAVDAADREASAALFQELAPIDQIVLALSGAAGAGAFATLPEEQLRAGFEGKFWLHVRALQTALPALAPQASITLITAGSARMALHGTAGLAAINGALQAIVPPLAAELAPRRVNAVSPGVIDTPWWDAMPAEQRDGYFRQFAAWLPAGRVGQPEEVADAVFLLATNGYITGVVLDCDGGGHLALGAAA